METIREETQVTVELKYCEWCGALWLRPPERAESYCGACARWFEGQLPAARPREA